MTAMPHRVFEKRQQASGAAGGLLARPPSGSLAPLTAGARTVMAGASAPSCGDIVLAPHPPPSFCVFWKKAFLEGLDPWARQNVRKEE